MASMLPVVPQRESAKRLPTKLVPSNLRIEFVFCEELCQRDIGLSSEALRLLARTAEGRLENPIGLLSVGRSIRTYRFLTAPAGRIPLDPDLPVLDETPTGERFVTDRARVARVTCTISFGHRPA
jgi:hypothetical protein